MFMKIYIPNMEDYQCFVVQSEGVVRSYEQIPTYNSTINYRDYYINGNYIYREGSQNFSTYSTLPTCLSSDVITNDVYYRNDFDKILIIFLIMSIFIFYIPIKIFKRLFKRFL